METLEYPEDFLGILLNEISLDSGKLESMLGVSFSFRGSRLFLDGDEEKTTTTREIFDELLKVHRAGCRLGPGDLNTAVRLKESGFKGELLEFYRDGKVQCSPGRSVFPKGLNQGRYMNQIRERDMVFSVGPAGTGKTFLAVAMAVASLREKFVKRLILTRPAVEAGERLGFLPGDMVEKVNPYLRPLYDALYNLMEADQVHHLIESGIIEVAPIAFMRGRTFNDAFVIFDEAQNSTIEQMKMFLTRMGFNSKAVITGDITQIDIAPSRRSGLVDACDTIKDVEGVAFTFFTEQDVVRHPLVQRIIRAYERAEKREKS